MKLWIAWALFIAGTALAAVLAPSLYAGSGLQKWMIKLPRKHDARLVGAWDGSLPTGDPGVDHPITTYFHKDGTGEFIPAVDFVTRFDWGTEGGTLYMRWKTGDSWRGSQHRYTVPTARNTVDFSGIKDMDFVSGEMTRMAATDPAWKNLEKIVREAVAGR